jgi:hypothetical protein
MTGLTFGAGIGYRKLQMTVVAKFGLINAFNESSDFPTQPLLRGILQPMTIE